MIVIILASLSAASSQQDSHVKKAVSFPMMNIIVSITVEPRQLKLPWERKTAQDNGEFVCG